MVGFPEFLQALEEEATNDERKKEIQATISVKLERQVGSKYFVTSRNAGRLFFLAPFVVLYLEQLEKTKELNNLEKDVLHHFDNDTDLANSTRRANIMAYARSFRNSMGQYVGQPGAPL